MNGTFDFRPWDAGESVLQAVGVIMLLRTAITGVSCVFGFLTVSPWLAVATSEDARQEVGRSVMTNCWKLSERPM